MSRSSPLARALDDRCAAGTFVDDLLDTRAAQQRCLGCKRAMQHHLEIAVDHRWVSSVQEAAALDNVENLAK